MRFSPNDSLLVANGSKIKAYGKRKIMLSLSYRSVTWKFVLADVHQPILGAEFFCKHRIAIDMANKGHNAIASYASTPTYAMNSINSVNGLHMTSDNDFDQIIYSLPDLLILCFSLVCIMNSWFKLKFK